MAGGGGAEAQGLARWVLRIGAGGGDRCEASDGGVTDCTRGWKEMAEQQNDGILGQPRSTDHERMEHSWEGAGVRDRT
jgi:hypothetical protein